MAKCSPELLAWAQQHDVEDIFKHEGNIERITQLCLNCKAYALPDCLGELKYLEGLYLTGMNLDCFPGWIRQCKRLTQLNVWDNHIQVLPDWLGELRKLKILYVRGNEIAALPASITELLGLEKFDADYNQITALPFDLGRLRALKELKLTNNLLSELPESLAYLRNLELLWLNDNRLTALPELIGNLDWVKEFRVYGNRLQRLPASVGKLTRVSSLDVSDNRLEELPESIGNLAGLYQLRLSSNRLHSLPDSVCDLSHLNWLWVNENRLTRLPEELGRLQQLQGMDASHNALTEIPASVQSMHGLRSFHLDGNPLKETFELPYERQFKHGDLPEIKLKFAQFFSFCGLKLPDDAIQQRRNGYVCDEADPDYAFHVAHFCFGKSDDREYLDFYMDSHYTGALHRRLYEDGAMERLPVYSPGYSYSGDATEEEKAQREAEWHQYNDEISIMLKKKFGI